MIDNFKIDGDAHISF